MAEDSSSIKKVLVTGGSGFIGSHLVGALLARGYETACLLRRDVGRTTLRGREIRVFTGNLGDPAGLERAVRGVDAICHLAGNTRGPKFWAANALGTANLVGAVSRANPELKRFVFISSLAAQGPGPIGLGLTESDPANPVSAYGRSKLAAEKSLSGLPPGTGVTILRPPVVYGPGDDSPLALIKSIQRGFLPLVCGPEKKFSLLYAADLVRTVTACLERPRAEGTFLLSDGGAYTLKEMGEAIGRILKARYRAVPIPGTLFASAALAAEGWSLLSGKRQIFGWDKFLEISGSNWEVDCAPARERLGFAPEYDLNRGFAETLRWYADNGLLRAP